MASNRINRINEEIQKALADQLRTVKDPRVAEVMISITRVETTPDLRYAKVYVSFLEETKAADAMKGLKSAGGWVLYYKIRTIRSSVPLWRRMSPSGRRILVYRPLKFVGAWMPHWKRSVCRPIKPPHHIIFRAGKSNGLRWLGFWQWSRIASY